jgi:hypothetical protein
MSQGGDPGSGEGRAAPLAMEEVEIPAGKMKEGEEGLEEDTKSDQSTTSSVGAEGEKEQKKLLTQMQDKLKNEETHSAVESIEHAICDMTGQTSQNGEEPRRKRAKIHTRIYSSLGGFFSDEWEAFKKERRTKFAEKEKTSTLLDFDELQKEWTYTEDNKLHWENQKKKESDDDTFPPLFYSIIIGLLFTVVPNGAIVLDLAAAREYLGGAWYIKREYEFNSTLQCRPVDGISGQRECWETDPIWGTLTLIVLFLPGFFWSLGIFIQFAIYLRRNNPEKYDRKRMLFFFFIPLAAVCMVTFPVQLMTVSIISTFNNQDHWMTLTSKVGIAEGMFNAHPQYLLQLFVFFVKADRHPSFFQYAAAFGSLLFLVWSRIESLLLERGGHHNSPGQKAWWICRFGPMFLFNSAFKIGSISLITSMLRYNAIWFYGAVIIVWLLLQFLFNEGYLHRKFYFLFIGAGLHAVSIPHIDEEIKIIKTFPDASKNTLYVHKLTNFQRNANMWFQNILWFTVNSIIIIAITIMAEMKDDAEFSEFWPFLSTTVSFNDNKVFRGLYIIAPIILTAGLISLVLLWMCEFHAADRDEINNQVKNAVGIAHPQRTKSESSHRGSQYSQEETDGAGRMASTKAGRQDSEQLSAYPGWSHETNSCQGCQKPNPAWHKFKQSGTVTQVRGHP